MDPLVASSVSPKTLSARITPLLKNGIWIAIILLILWLVWEPIVGFWNILGNRQELIVRIQQYGMFGPLILFLLLIFQVILPMTPGQVLMIASGYIYGPLWGSLLTAVSIFLSGELGFAIARYVGRPIVYHLASPKVITRWEKLASHQGTLFYIFSFILPFFPNDLMIYVAGLGSISPRRFALANFIGRLPISVSITILGGYGLRPPTVLWFAFVAFMLLMLAGWYRLACPPNTKIKDVIYEIWSLRDQ